MKTLYKVDEVSKMINDGELLLLSGDERNIKNLPKGKWIAGTTPYFMSERGGIISKDEIQVIKIPKMITEFSISTYSSEELKDIPADYLINGFSYIIIPAFSQVHTDFAKYCSTYKGLFDKPLMGWISGFDIFDNENKKAKAINGLTGEITDSKAVVMHLNLPTDKYARVSIINLFKQGSGDSITFNETSFEIKDCEINGKKKNFSEYLAQNKINTQLPLVANYMGAMINVSFKSVNQNDKTVSLYAPVFPGIVYKVASPILKYEEEFEKELHKANLRPFFSCNCILNFLYANLEGKKTGHIYGPMSFGEIAYMLLNQTMVYLTIENKVK